MTNILPKVFAFHLHLLDCLKENRTPHLIYHLPTTVQTVIFVPRLSINSRELRIINQLPLFLASVLWKSVTEHKRFPHLHCTLKEVLLPVHIFFMNLCGWQHSAHGDSFFKKRRQADVPRHPQYYLAHSAVPINTSQAGWCTAVPSSTPAALLIFPTDSLLSFRSVSIPTNDVKSAGDSWRLNN